MTCDGWALRCRLTMDTGLPVLGSRQSCPALERAETEAEKARYRVGLRQVAKARERMTELEIKSVVDKLADIARLQQGGRG